MFIQTLSESQAYKGKKQKQNKNKNKKHTFWATNFVEGINPSERQILWKEQI